MLREEGGGGVEDGSSVTCIVTSDVRYSDVANICGASTNLLQ